MSRVLLTVDLSWQVYRNCAAHPQLRTPDGTFTGGVYGFLQSFSKAVRETGATDVVVCRDSKPYRRSLDYPAYKQLRKTAQDPDLRRMYGETEPIVLDLLGAMGVPVWAVPGFEADDLSGHAVRSCRSRYSRIYANANDSDLYQLLDAPGFAVYKDSIGLAVDRSALLRLHGLSPHEFLLASALQGTHNDIEGIKGVGPKKAMNAVLDPALMRGYRAAHGDVIDRNLALIRLPHPDFPRDERVPQRGAVVFDARRLYRWCSRYEIECTLSMVNAFEQIDNRRHTNERDAEQQPGRVRRRPL